MRRFLLLGILLLAHNVAAQTPTSDLLGLLRAERQRVWLQEKLDAIGPRAVPVPPIEIVPADGMASFLTQRRQARLDAERAAAEAARQDSLAVAAAEARVLTQFVWRKVEADIQGEFLERFREVFWTTEGTVGRTPLDTMRTWRARGFLAYFYGSPTRNAAAMEQEQYATDDRSIQFEYWFVVNDTIPVLVMDLNGPRDAGLLIAGDREKAYLMPQIKRDLAGRLAAANRMTPYVDYYLIADENQWYRTGWDGFEFFRQPIRTPRWARGPSTGEGFKWRIHR